MRKIKVSFYLQKRIEENLKYLWSSQQTLNVSNQWFLDCNLYGLPGGKIELFEEPEESAARELKEETNILLKPEDFKLIKVKNFKNREKELHYVNFYYFVRFPFERKLKNLEYEKTQEWIWMDEDEISKKNNEIFWWLLLFAADYGGIHNLMDLLKTV